MLHTKNPHPLAKGRGSRAISLAADPESNIPNAPDLQISKLVRRFRISPELAATVAELCFSTKEARS